MAVDVEAIVARFTETLRREVGVALESDVQKAQGHVKKAEVAHAALEAEIKVLKREVAELEAKKGALGRAIEAYKAELAAK